MQKLPVRSTSRNEFINITSDIQQKVRDENWQNGILYVVNPHTTAGLTINEGADPSVQRDILMTLSRLIPYQGDYHHGEGNSDAHIKASLMGNSLMVPVLGGRPALGRWQAVFFCEFDGPRNRNILLKFQGD